MSPGRLFCFGLGYTAGRLAAALRARGWEVAGTVRDPARAAAWRAEGVAAWAFDRGRPLARPAEALAGATHVLSSVPPAGDGAGPPAPGEDPEEPAADPVLAVHAADLVRAHVTGPGLRWVGYLSSTGVYGDHGGAWVAAERTAPRPSGPRGVRRLAAEEAWRALGARHGLPVHVFRLAGIYGPGRSALDAARAGAARRVRREGLETSRVHVDDAVDALLASIARPCPGAVYDLADDLPAPPDEVVAEACALLGVAAPPVVDWEQAGLSPLARSFYADRRRVDNAPTKAALGWTPRHPDFRAGLRALLASEGAGAGGPP